MTATTTARPNPRSSCCSRCAEYLEAALRGRPVLRRHDGHSAAGSTDGAGADRLASTPPTREDVVLSTRPGNVGTASTGRRIQPVTMSACASVWRPPTPLAPAGHRAAQPHGEQTVETTTRPHRAIHLAREKGRRATWQATSARHAGVGKGARPGRKRRSRVRAAARRRPSSSLGRREDHDTGE
jgi:hypothetical protein